VFDAALLAADVTVLDVDLRGLRETRQLLVGRLGGDDARRIGTEIGEAHGETPGIERMKLHEAGPGLVKQNVFAEMPDPLQDHFGIVNGAVIGALLDHGDAEGARLLPGFAVLDQRVVADAFAQLHFVEGVPTHGTDQSPGVARRRNVDRDAAAHHQGAMVGRLVVVAIEQDQVLVGDERAQRYLVRRRGAVEHEVGFFRAEYLGGFLLRLQRRALVGQEVAEIEHRIVEVVAEHGLAEVLHEHPSDRAAAVKHAAVMARAGP